jgi:hypothetical protein
MDTRTPTPLEPRFDQLMLGEAACLPALGMSGGLTGIEDETLPDGSLRRKAQPMAETVCFWGWKTRQQAELTPGAWKVANMVSRKTC